jgi:glycosidase
MYQTNTGGVIMKRILALTLALVLVLALFAGCQKDPTPSGSTEGTTAAPETTEPAPKEELAVPVPAGVTASEDNARVFYEIFVGSFSDSDGDGVGDLRGIINRMDYLNDGDERSGKSLGVEGIWLTPIFSSGSYHKYDVNDYYAVDRSFGTLDDLKELVELCHSRNVKLILDLPINHTSRSNVWFNSFTRARQNGAVDDPYYNFYSCYTQGETAPAGRTFNALSGTNVYYECNFDGGMPELNFDSEDVRLAVLDVAKYWMDLGVDGFRFDAAKYVYYGDHTASAEFWVWYLNELKALNPDVYTVAEVWDADGITDLYYPAMNCFDFTTSQAEGMIASAAKKGAVARYTEYLQSYLNTVTALREDAMVVPFIANHDTDRAAGYLPSAGGYAQMAANLLLLSPGSPFMYYGEELGMRGSRGGANTDANRRLAMVWGDGDTVKDPTGTTYSADRRADAPANEQVGAEDSLYNHYKKVLLLRKANPEIARGDFTSLKLSGSKTGGFVSDWNGSRVAVFHNASDADAVTIDLAALGLTDLTVVSGFVGMNEASLSGTTLTLGAQTSVVLRAG